MVRSWIIKSKVDGVLSWLIVKLLVFVKLFSLKSPKKSQIISYRNMANRPAAIGFSGFRPRYNGNIYNRPEVRAAREGKLVKDLEELESTEKCVF